MIKLHYNQAGTIMGAYADNDQSPEPNISVEDGSWASYDTIENGALVHNGAPIEVVRGNKLAEMKGAYDSSLSTGFTTNGILMDAEASKVAVLKQAYDIRILNSDTVMNITDFNNATNADVPVATALAMITELGLNAMSEYDNWQALRTTINSASTIQEIEAVTW